MKRAHAVGVTRCHSQACARCAQLERELADAHADMQEFTQSSHELQDELEKELAALESSEKELRNALELARAQGDEHKVRVYLCACVRASAETPDTRRGTTLR